jgi:hypothetical protein
MMVAKVNRLFLSRGPVENLTRFVILYCFIFGELRLLAGGVRRTWALQSVLLGTVVVGVLVYADDRLRMPGDAVMLMIGSWGALEQVSILRTIARRSHNEDALV